MITLIDKMVNILNCVTSLKDYFCDDPERHDLFLGSIYPVINILEKLRLCVPSGKELITLINQLRIMKRANPDAIEAIGLLVGDDPVAMGQLKSRMELFENLLDKLEDLQILIEIEEFV